MSDTAAGRRRTMAPVQQFSLYGSGFFSLSLQSMINLVVPLWALDLGAPPFLIGVAVSATSFIIFLFAIPAGAVTDRIGARAVLLVSSLTAAAVSFLYPIFPEIVPLIAIQMVGGFFRALTWIAAQTLVAKVGRDGAVSMHHMVRFSFATSVGNLIAPVLAGYIADAQGLTVAFLLTGVWAGCLAATAVLLPRLGGEARPPSNWRDTVRSLMPRATDYTRALHLLAVPGIWLVLYGSFLRIAVAGFQGSFYPVYLAQIALPKTWIGILLSVSSASGSIASLAVDHLSRWVAPGRLLVLGLGASVVAVTLTPLFTSTWVFLGLAVIMGSGFGLSLPLLMSILAGATTPDERGLSVGLRVGVNRVTTSAVPVVLGVAIQLAGLHTGFFLVGALLVATVPVALLLVDDANQRRDRAVKG